MSQFKSRNFLLIMAIILFMAHESWTWSSSIDSKEINVTISSLMEILINNVTTESIPDTLSSKDIDMGTDSSVHTEPEQNIMAEMANEIQELESNIQNLETRFAKEIAAINETLLLQQEQDSSNDIFLQSYDCGEVLVGRRGQINYIHNINSSTSLPSYCIWTIRTGRELIKIETDSDMVTMNSLQNKVYILEPVEGVSELKFTRLKALQNQVFQGPFLFVWLSMADATPGKFTFQLEFEGLGKTTPEYKSSHFAHEILEYSPEQEIISLGWENASQNDSNGFSKEILTLTSNFSTRTFININAENTTCSSTEKILVFTNLNQENGRILGTDCCESNCKSIMTKPQIPLVAIISKNNVKSMQFKISMISEPVYESSYTYQENEPCGGVLSGMNGVIDYKSAQQYNNNERCIWTIIPGPYATKSLAIKVTHNGLEARHDKLYTMKIGDFTGNILHETPKLTELSQTNMTYSVTGKVFYIVFYSDMSITGSGFRLEYKAEKTNSSNTSNENIYNSYNVQTTVNGSVTLNMANWQRQHQTTAVTPKLGVNDTNSQLQLHFSSEQNCNASPNIYVFSTKNGLFSKPSKIADCFTSSTLHVEEMALVLIDNDKATTDATPTISWELTQTRQTNASFVKTDGKTCGGVIEADSGIIQYKMNVNVGLEDCIWTIVTNNDNLNVTLIKQGLGSASSLRLFAVEFDQGTLRSLTMSQSSPQAFVNSSAAILVLKSVNANNQTGFIIEFESTGNSNKTTNFISMHSTDSNGKYSSNWHPNGDSTQDFAKTIHIFTHTSNVSDSVVNSDFQYGLFRKEKGCAYETITIYDVLPTGVSQLTQLPRSSDKADCLDLVAVAKIRPWFTTKSGSFIVVHKTISPMPITSFEWRQEIIEVKDVFTTSCGGTVNGRSGIIAYRENGSYDNGVSCTWSVNGPPGSKSIAFTLENQGFENCCDYITVTPSIGSSTRLGHRSDSESMKSTVVIQGAAANVVFKSDGSVSGKGFRLRFKAQ